MINHLPILLLLQTSTTRNNFTTFISNVVNQFDDYAITAYYDNTTLTEIDDLLQSKTSIYVVNYDLESVDGAYKSDGFKHLHLIFVDNPLKQQSSRVEINVSFRDIILIISKTYITKTKLRKICELDRFCNAGGVFIFANHMLFNCYYYRGRDKVSWKKISIQNGEVPQLKQFVNDYTNFDGYLFKVGYTVLPPFFYCRYDKNQKCVKYHGAESQIVRTLSKTLNFQYEFIEYFRAVDSNASRSPWDMMVADVRFGKIDWAVAGFYQTLDRTRVMDFARYIKWDEYTAIYNLYRDDWTFTLGLLYAMFYSKGLSTLEIVITAIAVATVVKFSLKIFSGIDISLVDSIVMTAVNAIDQVSSRLQKRINYCRPIIKMLFLLWWFSIWYLSTVYKSHFASSLLTVPKCPKDLEDIAGKNFQFEVHKNNLGYLQSNCINPSLKTCSKISKSFLVSTDYCDSLQRVLEHSVIFIEGNMILQYMALRECKLTLKQKGNLRIITANAFNTKWQAWPSQKNSPFVDSFTQVIGRLDASGLIEYWYRRKLSFYQKMKISNQDYLQEEAVSPLSTTYFLIPFTFATVGNFISLMTFLVELKSVKSKTK